MGIEDEELTNNERRVSGVLMLIIAMSIFVFAIKTLPFIITLMIEEFKLYLLRQKVFYLLGAFFIMIVPTFYFLNRFLYYFLDDIKTIASKFHKTKPK